MTFNGGRRRSVGRRRCHNASREEESGCGVSTIKKKKRKRKKELFGFLAFLSFCVASAARCLPRSPLAPSFPTAEPARKLYGLILSHCVVVASEFITTGLELFGNGYRNHQPAPPSVNCRKKISQVPPTTCTQKRPANRHRVNQTNK